jgi:rubrerythrin
MYYFAYWPAEYARYAAQREGAAFTDQGRFLQMVLQAIYKEREAQLFYRTLEERADSPFQSRQIHHAFQDEVKHESMLTELYQTLTGQQPVVLEPQFPEIPDYQTAIRNAFEDELDAAEMYRSMYLMTRLRWVRDIMFQLMTDEMEHATRFSYIRAEL